MSKRVKIADLKFDPENARVRTAKGEAMIQESLRQVGAARSIVIDENGTILAGNGTVEAAGQIGIDNVVIVEASGDEIIAVRRKGLTDEQKKKLAYYDNRTGDEAEWDMEQVARDLLGGYDFLDELFDDIQVPEPEKEGTDELPEDPAEVLREKWGVEYGDLWQIGPHRILCGDSTEKEDVDRLLDGFEPQLLIADPPYGMSYSGVAGTAQKGMRLDQIRKVKPIHGDNKPYNPMDAVSLVSCKEVYLWGGDWFYDKLPPGGSWIVWDKRASEAADAIPGSPFEVCWSMKNHAREFLRVPWGGWINKEDGGTRWHPTQKPTECVAFALRKHKQDFYDPFCGSGTSMVAAHNEGRICYAMEIDPAYVAVCVERMAQLGYDPDKVEKLKG